MARSSAAFVLGVVAVLSVVAYGAAASTNMRGAVETKFGTYVPTPAGLILAECVHDVPSDAIVEVHNKGVPECMACMWVIAVCILCTHSKVGAWLHANKHNDDMNEAEEVGSHPGDCCGWNTHPHPSLRHLGRRAPNDAAHCPPTIPCRL